MARLESQLGRLTQATAREPGETSGHGARAAEKPEMENRMTQRIAPADAPPIGQYWQGQGGIYAGIMPDYVGHEPKHLIFSADEAVGMKWGGVGHIEPGATSDYDGAANTRALVASEISYPVAQWADNYEKDGHTDFHLPSRLELQVGATTIPDQFSSDGWYWSSTDDSKYMVPTQDFGATGLDRFFKHMTANARAVRTIPVA
ncbi:MAG TPA: hypothetical protein VNZ04_00550 [Trinickia sp.]|jgi:hypothetical protein|nr:hypothetical protein [Trinickia sp.]